MSGIMLFVVGAVLLLFGVFLMIPENKPSLLQKAAAVVLSRDHDELGWLDDQEFTAADRARVSEITGSGIADGQNGHLVTIRRIQAGNRSNIQRRDIELLRQDRRRATAAYPDISQDTLFQSVWLQIDLDAKIPMEWNTSHNGDGTKGKDGKWYMDGGMYTAFTSPKYPNRASADETVAFFKARAEKRLADKLARDHIWWASGGSGGSLNVDCKDGICVVHQADEWASRGKIYTFPFVAAEWVTDPGSMEKIRALPSFAAATVEDENVRPNGVTVGGPISVQGTDPNFVPYRPGMTLMPGQSTGVSVALPAALPRN